jgi:hypothetical protein
MVITTVPGENPDARVGVQFALVPEIADSKGAL